MRKSLFVVGLFLSACGPIVPVVSDFNGSSVKIQEPFGTLEPTAQTVAEAGRICGKVGKKAEYASTVALPNYQSEYLFLCL